MKRIYLYLSLFICILLSSCSMLIQESKGSLSFNLPQSRVLESRTPIVYTATLTSNNKLYEYQQVGTDHVLFTDLVPEKYTLSINGEDSNNYYNHEEEVDILSGEPIKLKVVLTVTPKSPIVPPSPNPDVESMEIFDTTYSIDTSKEAVIINTLPQERIPKGTKTISLGREIKTPGFENCNNEIIKTDYVTTNDLTVTYAGDPFVLQDKEYSYTLYYKDANDKVLAKSNPLNVKPTFMGLNSLFSLPNRTLEYIPTTNTTTWKGMPNQYPGDTHVYSIVYENISTKERIEGTFIAEPKTGINNICWNDYPDVKDGKYKLLYFKDTANAYNAVFNLHVYAKEIQVILPDLVTEIDLKRTQN